MTTFVNPGEERAQRLSALCGVCGRRTLVVGFDEPRWMVALMPHAATPSPPGQFSGICFGSNGMQSPNNIRVEPEQ